MNLLGFLRIRLLHTALLVGLLASAVGCASAPGASPESTPPDASAPIQADAPKVRESDPFEVARVWAASLGAGATLAPEVQSITANWDAAQVARVWAAGDEYRALIIEKSTTGARPAVLLYVSRDPSGAWGVEAIKPSTSTELWSQF